MSDPKENKTDTGTNSGQPPGTPAQPEPQPHSLDLEEAIVGCVLMAARSSVRQCREVFQRGTRFLYVRALACIYTVVEALVDAGHDVDVAMVAGALEREGKLAEIGGRLALDMLTGRVTSLGRLPGYLIEQRGFHQKRGLRQIKTELGVALADGESEYTGLALDYYAPFEPGNQTILAARTSVGKTGLAVWVALRRAQAGHPVGCISVEMSAPQLSLRLANLLSGVSGAAVRRRGGVSEAEFERLEAAFAELASLPLHIYDGPALDLVSICDRLRVWRDRHRVEFGVVDYLQLVQPSRRFGTREEAVSESSRVFKLLAKELDIPLLVLCQLSRAPAKEDREPTLADLRESGAIEQNADAVVLLHKVRELQTPPEAWLVQANVAKQRNGDVGERFLVFDRERQRFQDADGQQGPP